MTDQNTPDAEPRPVVRLSVNLAPTVADALKELSEQHGVTLTEGVRRAIIAWRNESAPWNEPTDDDIDAFQDAWAAENRRQGEGDGEPGARTRAGLTAVFAARAAR